ncbi:sensor histidine kinase [Bacillus sp. DJP31]|uniref:sensor histidine kinase n=1 Tax=Bacillus sp. DJP31 TaxID=3409789 RepID=UPI003BB7A471
MKVRTILLSANLLSNVIMIIFLVIAYFRMFLPEDMIILLTAITIAGALLSFVAHFILTSPILKSIQSIAKESKRVADGDFNGTVPKIGPLEMQELAESFNNMSANLSSMFTKLKQSEESRKQLIANVSHDLRTPLSSIQSYVEALQDGIIEDESTKEKYLKTIQLETERLGTLIEDLFQLSQLEAGKMQFLPKAYHVDQLLLECIQPLEIKLKQNQVSISVKISPEISSVLIVPDQMRRVIFNLLQNAIYYSHPDSTIKIEAQNVDTDYVFISVEDEGIGIEEDELDKVFERFYRVEKSRNKTLGGSGLGLAIAKEIVELHGGKIKVESTFGQGSKFSRQMLS